MIEISPVNFHRATGRPSRLTLLHRYRNAIMGLRAAIVSGDRCVSIRDRIVIDSSIIKNILGIRSGEIVRIDYDIAVHLLYR